MTKTIEDTLGLPRLEDALKEIQEANVDNISPNVDVERMANALQNLDSSQLISRDEEGVDTLDSELNEVITKAMKGYEEISDLGFNVESKNAGEILNAAARMLEIVASASKSKADARLKIIKARMEREKLDSELKKNQIEGVIDGEEEIPSIYASRNDLMNMLKKKTK